VTKNAISNSVEAMGELPAVLAGGCTQARMTAFPAIGENRQPTSANTLIAAGPRVRTD
jgi:hypothetical protein